MDKTNFLLSSSNDDGNSLIFDQNSWVNFTVLDIGADYKVKRIEVLPLKQLSFQNNESHAKHWTVVQGTAEVTINDHTFSVKAGETIDFKLYETHYVENPDNSEILVFIDVQCGFSDLDEDLMRWAKGFGKIARAA